MHQGMDSPRRSLSRLKYVGFRDDAFEGWVRNSKLSHYRTCTFLDKQVTKAQIFSGLRLAGADFQRAWSWLAASRRGAAKQGRIAISSRENRVETAIGVFASRDHAEAAVKDLLSHGVPEPAIVFLTRAEGDATTTGSGQEVAAVPGAGKELPAGITSSASMVVPGVGRVFALGARAAGLLGFLGGGSGAAVGPRVSSTRAGPTHTRREMP